MSAETAHVDETPISPVRQGIERRNSLEKHLQHRPEAQDLKNRHILLDTAAAPYVSASPSPLSTLFCVDRSTFAEQCSHLAYLQCTTSEGSRA